MTIWRKKEKSVLGESPYNNYTGSNNVVLSNPVAKTSVAEWCGNYTLHKTL